MSKVFESYKYLRENLKTRGNKKKTVIKGAKILRHFYYV